MKRILSFTLAVVMIVLCGQSAALASTYNFSDYSSFDDIGGWTRESTSYVSAELNTDGLTLTQTASKALNDDGTRNSTASGLLYGSFAATLETDGTNRTAVEATKLKGVYDIDIAYKSNVDREDKIGDVSVGGFYNVMVGVRGASKLSAIYTYVRVDAGNTYFLNSNSEGKATLKSRVKTDNTKDAEHIMHLTYDTENKTQSVSLDDGEAVSGTYPGSKDYLDGVEIRGLERMNVGSYFTVKSVDVKKVSYASAVEAVLNQLPEKLSDDVNAVTENITLPSVSGVTWKSDNTSVISDSGVVTRPSADTDVKITASFDGMAKVYTMTVKKSEGGDTPTPPDPPAPEPSDDGKLVFEENNYTTLQSLDKWYYNDSNMSEVSVKDGKLVITATDTMQNRPDGSLNSNNSTYIGKTFEQVEDIDTEKGTQMVKDGFSGRYALEFTFKSNMTTHRLNATDPTRLANTYYFITFGYRAPTSTSYDITDEYADLRIPGYASKIGAEPSSGKPYFYHTNAAGTKVNYTLGTSYYEQDTTIKLVFDTVNKTIDGYMKNENGDFQLYQKDIPFISGYGTSGILNAMKIRCQEAFDVGSYFELSDIKIYEVEPDKTDSRLTKGEAFLKEMPESLVQDYKNVTETELSLPGTVAENAVSWVSGNDMMLTNSGVITKWVDPVETYITGGTSFTSDEDSRLRPIGFYKRYKLNIPIIDGAETKKLYDFENSENGWKTGYIGEMSGAEHSFESNGVVLKKTLPSDPTAYKNEKLYYAVQNIKGLERAYDASSHSALYSDAFCGIYDLDFNVEAFNSSSERPATVEVGYYNDSGTVFKPLGSIEVYNTKMTLKVNTLPEKTETYSLSPRENGGKNAVRMRFDTNLQKVWVYVNGALSTQSTGISYYNMIDPMKIVNAVRVSIDKNLDADDYIKVEDAVFTQKMYTSVEEKDSVIAASDLISVSDITDDSPESVKNNLKTLPKSAGNYSVKWTSSDEDMINPETGEVFGSVSDSDVTLTAQVYDSSAQYPISVYKEFKLTVPKASGADGLKYQLNKLKLEDYTKQSLDSVVYDISLPSSNEFGTAISWSSSDPSVIGNDGKISTDALTAARKIILTATLTSGGVSATKDFEITVAPHGKMHVFYSGDGSSFNVNGTADVSLYGNVWLELKKGSTDGTVSVYDSKGTKAFDVDVTSDVKIFVMPQSGIYNIVDNMGTIVAEGLPINSDAENIASVSYAASVLDGVTVKGDTYALLETAKNNIPFNAPKAVTADITLPSDDVAGAKIEWKSENAGVLTADGTLTVPEKYTFVTLTAVLTADGISSERKYVLTVPCDKSKNILLNAGVSASSAAKSGYPLANAVDGDAETYTEFSVSGSGTYLTADMGGERYFNSIYFAQPAENVNSYRLAYSADGSNWTDITSGTVEKAAALVEFDTVSGRYIRIYLTGASEKTVRISAFEAFLNASAAELEEMDLELIKLDSEYQVTKNITLPAKGVYGTTFTWTSSDASVISAAGVYTKPSVSKTVTLTASTPSGKTRTFEFYAVGTSGGTGPVPSGGGSSSGGSGGGGGNNYGNGVVATPDAPVSADTSNTAGKLFGDVKDTDWYYTYVARLKALGVVNGDEKGNFNPENKVAREEFVKMLVIAGGINASGDAELTDVSKDGWYYKYVAAAYASGIVTGLGDGTFGIGTNVTRQDMAVMIYRLLKSKNISASTDKFADDSEIADYAKDAVYVLRAAGILDGYENRFSPLGYLTRAEAAKVISVLMTLI